MPVPLRADRLLYTVQSSSAWVRYFCSNRQSLAPICWKTAPKLEASEREVIAASIAEFQLGESSEGRNLSRRAGHYAEQTGDSEYAHAIGLFIAEENRHARDLGGFMDMAGIPRKNHTLADRVFRRLRTLAGLELAIMVLLTAEIIAQVYYRALRDATENPALRSMCRQILRDERAHVQFQSERLAILRQRIDALSLLPRDLFHRALMTGAVLVVWRNHGRVLRSGGYTFRRFWRSTWTYTEWALKIANPVRYDWPATIRAVTP